MITRLAGGRIVDPVSGPSLVRDLYVADGRIVAPPADPQTVGSSFDCRGRMVMAGAIDLGGPAVGLAGALARLAAPDAARSAGDIGRRYAEIGVTLVVDPALPPTQALHGHLELADLGPVDRVGFAALGNDDRLLRLLADRAGRKAIADHVGETLAAARAFGISAVAPGASAAFHAGRPDCGFDEPLPHYGVTGAEILDALIDAAGDLGLPSPLRLEAGGRHGASLSRLREMVGDRPLHLSGLGGLAEAAPQAIADLIAAAPNLTADVGLTPFGDAVATTLDLGAAHRLGASGRLSPAIVLDGDAEGATAGTMTFDADDPADAGRWAASLRLLLDSPDPSRLMLTIGPPGVGGFAALPGILRLLANAEARDKALLALPWEVIQRSGLNRQRRQYAVEEIAVLTRVAPARLLGLADRGHLLPGAVADIAVYDDLSDVGAALAAARLVFKDGRLAVESGKVRAGIHGRTLTAAIARRSDPLAADYLVDRFGVGSAAFEVPGAAFERPDGFVAVPCRTASGGAR